MLLIVAPAFFACGCTILEVWKKRLCHQFGHTSGQNTTSDLENHMLNWNLSSSRTHLQIEKAHQPGQMAGSMNLIMTPEVSSWEITAEATTSQVPSSLSQLRWCHHSFKPNCQRLFIIQPAKFLGQFWGRSYHIWDLTSFQNASFAGWNKTATTGQKRRSFCLLSQLGQPWSQCLPIFGLISPGDLRQISVVCVQPRQKKGRTSFIALCSSWKRKETRFFLGEYTEFETYP